MDDHTDDSILAGGRFHSGRSVLRQRSIVNKITTKETTLKMLKYDFMAWALLMGAEHFGKYRMQSEQIKLLRNMFNGRNNQKVTGRN